MKSKSLCIALLVILLHCSFAQSAYMYHASQRSYVHVKTGTVIGFYDAFYLNRVKKAGYTFDNVDGIVTVYEKGVKTLTLYPPILFPDKKKSKSLDMGCSCLYGDNGDKYLLLNDDRPLSKQVN